MTKPDIDAIKTELPADARMNAYYYGFDRTGVGLIDAILSAVAVAGKGSHHTESWWDEDEFGHYSDWPGLPDGAPSAVDLIQATATRSAEQVAALLAYIEELEAQVERVRELHAPVEIEPSETICLECSNMLPNRRFLPVVEYPCPTMQALGGGGE